MRIVIEIEGGSITGIYNDDPHNVPEIAIRDEDQAEVGEDPWGQIACETDAIRVKDAFEECLNCCSNCHCNPCECSPTRDIA